MIALLVFAALSTQPMVIPGDAPAPGGMKLLPGYVHERLQGIDSIVGRIVKKEGLSISYEIGHVPKPGGPVFGGSFSDYPKNTPADQRLWYKEQTIAGREIHTALTKTKTLMVSFPASGINFSTAIKSEEDVAEALLLILSFQGLPAAR